MSLRKKTNNRIISSKGGPFITTKVLQRMKQKTKTANERDPFALIFLTHIASYIVWLFIVHMSE